MGFVGIFAYAHGVRGHNAKGFVKGLCDGGLYSFAYKECPRVSWANAKGFVTWLFDESASSRVQRALSEKV